jgi:hypothetical protein
VHKWLYYDGNGFESNRIINIPKKMKRRVNEQGGEESINTGESKGYYVIGVNSFAANLKYFLMWVFFRKRISSKTNFEKIA